VGRAQEGTISNEKLCERGISELAVYVNSTSIRNYIQELSQKIFRKNIIIFPLVGYSGYNSRRDYDVAKRPLKEGWNLKTYEGMTEEEIEKHISNSGWLGLRIPEGYIVVDIDDYKQGLFLYKLIENEGLNAHIIKTPRGFQFFFRDTGRVNTQSAKMLTKGLFIVDYRLAEKGYIVLPTENTENRYWIEASNDDLSPLPFWLEPLRKAKPEENIELPIPNGTRNDTLFRHVSRLRDYIKDEEEIRRIMFFINENLTEEELPLKELEKIIEKRAGYNYEVGKVEIAIQEEEEKYTDFWDAQNFVEMYKQKVRYCPAWNSWLVFREGKWIKDEKMEVERMAKELIRSYYKIASEITDDKKRKALIKHALKCETTRAINSILELAKPELTVTPQDFDTDNYILNVKNGILILDTKELMEHDPEILLTKMANVEYDPEATCPRWLEFLDTIFNGNKELIEFIQKAVGYTLSGDTGEDCFFILYGTGQNGKTTFLNTIQEILGDYCVQARAETFLFKEHDYIPNDIARLNNTRMVIATELPEGRRFNENLIKSLTGRDKITARFLRQEFFEFKPTFKLWIATNHKPLVYENTHAFWRRVKLIPFEVQIPEEKRIPHYEEKLLEERSGILNWALEGYLKWRKEKLGTTQKIIEATQTYKQEMDIIGDFIAECCEEGEQHKATTQELYEAYRKWALANSEEPITNRAFGRRLEERGYKSVKINHKRGWQGLTLKPEFKGS